MRRIGKKILFFSVAMAFSVIITACTNSDSSNVNNVTDNVNNESNSDTNNGDSNKSNNESSNNSNNTNNNTNKNTQTKGNFGSFSTVSIDGKEVTQDIFSQKELTMVNVWATYCSPCINEMPDLAEIAKEYEDKNFQIVGIISDVSQPNHKSALKIIETTNVDYLNIIYNKDMAKGYLNNIQAVPTTVFVDSNGNVVGKEYVGSKSKSQWIEIIDGLLK